MKKIYPYIIILIFLPFLAIAQHPQQQRFFDASNEVVLKLVGFDKDYDFRSDQFAGRFDQAQRRFEFIIPAISVYPLNDPADLSVFQDIFLANTVDPNIYVTADFRENLVDMREFKSPTEMVLDGMLTIYNRHYNIPVVMSLFYSNEVLYYKLRMDLDLFHLNWSIPPHHRSFLTGIMQIQVTDGKWSNLYKQ
ncbi:hypothetical protein BH23BAC1_BH23BAC1_20100 [soil metagenome]